MEAITNVQLCKVDFTLFSRKVCFDAISTLSPAACSKKEWGGGKVSQFRRISSSLAKERKQNKARGAHWRVGNLFSVSENNTIMSLPLKDS